MRASSAIAASIFLFSLVFSEGAAEDLSKTEIEASVSKISRLIEDNYVFEDTGKKIAKHFSSEHARGKFDSAQDWQEFASLATAVLRDFSGDGHLYIRHDPEAVKELTQPAQQSGSSDSNEEDAFFHGPKAREENYGFREVRILESNIGYIKLSEINISEKSRPVLFAVMRFVANTKALIIDLRENGGGGSEIGPVLESFFLEKNIALLEFRSRTGQVETSKTVALTEKRYDAPLFVIVNGKTGSAAEALAYALQSQGRAKIVGQRSGGAANMNSWYAINAYIYLSVSTGAPVLPGTKESWEGKGVQPDIPTAPGREIEAILQKMSSPQSHGGH